jgi:hypothetical protein
LGANSGSWLYSVAAVLLAPSACGGSPWSPPRPGAIARHRLHAASIPGAGGWGGMANVNQFKSTFFVNDFQDRFKTLLTKFAVALSFKISFANHFSSVGL